MGSYTRYAVTVLQRGAKNSYHQYQASSTKVKLSASSN